MKLEKRWNNLESMHRRFLKDEKHDSVFYACFCANYSDVFAENVVRSVRINAGLGNPPDAFYNNRSESMNRLLKSHVGHQRSSLPQFVRYLHNFIIEQFNNIKKANMSVLARDVYVVRSYWGASPFLYQNILITEWLRPQTG